MIRKHHARKEKAKVRHEHEKKIGKKEAVIHEPPPPVEIKIEKEKKFEQQTLFDLKAPEGKYEAPPLSMLEDPPLRETKIQRESLLMNSRLLEKKLLDFNVEGSVTEVAPGPVITMYEYEPAPGVKISKVAGLADDLGSCLEGLLHSHRRPPFPARRPSASKYRTTSGKMCTSRRF